MTATAKKRPLSMKALLILEFMNDRKCWLITTEFSHGPSISWDKQNGEYAALATSNDPAKTKLVPELDNGSLKQLRDRNFIQMLDANKVCRVNGLPTAVYSSDGKSTLLRQGYFAWYSHPNSITQAGREYLDANRESISKWREEQAAKPVELVIVCRRSYMYKDEQTRLPGPLYRVKSRTDKRLYLEHVDGYEDQRGDAYVRGSASGMCVDADNVFMSVETIEQYERIKEAANGYTESIAAVRTKSEEEIQAILEPVLKRQRDRETQLKAELDDMIQAALSDASPSAKM